MSAAPAPAEEVQQMKARAEELKQQAEKTRQDNDQNEQRFKQLKQLPEADLLEIQAKHEAMVQLYLYTGGQKDKADESIKKVAEIVRLDKERERAFLREKAELEAELNALQEQIESMKDLVTAEDEAELAAAASG